MVNYCDKLYINGEWIVSHGDDVIEVINPATEEVCGQVPRGKATDVDVAVKAARNAFFSWSTTSARERSRLIQALADALQTRALEIAATISMEQGSPIKFAQKVQARLPREVMGSFVQHALVMEQVEEVGHSEVVKEAIGVCALITPWNYPLHQIVVKVAPALAAGCTIVLKPSEVTPLNAFLLAEIIDEVGLPAGVFNLVSGCGSIVGEALCAHPDVDMVSFTGSSRAGRRVSEVAAETVKRVCLELGGKSANIILDDADLEKALRHNVYQVMANSGQTCVAQTRTLIPAHFYNDAIAITKAIVESIVVGDPRSEETFMGPMASAEQMRTVRNYIQIGLDQGATLVTGGVEALENLDRGYYVKPTVFANVNNNMIIAREEIFGPVMCLIAYGDETEAIAIANDSPYGLSGAVWSEDVKRAQRVAKKMRTGQVYINGARQNLLAPFGGYKQSGNGRELGLEGLNEFVSLKSIHINQN